VKNAPTSKTKTVLKLKPLGDQIVIAILTPSQVKGVDTAEGKKQIHLPDFGMYRVNGSVMADHLRIMGEFEQRDDVDVEADVIDARRGVWETRPTHKYRDYLLAIVIGENLDATFPEYDSRDCDLEPFHKRVVRRTRAFDAPKLGDLIIVNQSHGVDWTTFFKEPCDTNSACEFLITNADESRWILVPRNAEVATVPISDVLGYPMEKAAACHVSKEPVCEYQVGSG
jgi:hypothetical protein